MKKYIIYARVATQDQLHKNNLQAQIDTLKMLAESQKRNVVDIQEIIGRGKSFLKGLFKRIDQQEKIGLICTDLNRLTRDKSELSLLIHLAQQGKLEIVTPKFTLSKESLKNILFMVKTTDK